MISNMEKMKAIREFVQWIEDEGKVDTGALSSILASVPEYEKELNFEDS